MALFLRDRGFRAWALTGGYSAWRQAGHPIDTKAQETAREIGESCPECGRPWSEHADAS